MNQGAADLSAASDSNHIFTNPKYPMYISCGAPGNNEGVGSASPVISTSLVNFGSSTSGGAICDFTANSTTLYYQATATGGTSPGETVDYVSIVKD